jgi:thermitase
MGPGTHSERTSSRRLTDLRWRLALPVLAFITLVSSAAHQPMSIGLIPAGVTLSDRPSAQILVRYSAPTSAEEIRQIESGLGAQFVKTVPDLNVRVLRLPGDSASQAMAALEKRPEVAFAEPDAILKPQDVLPDDPSFPTGNFSIWSGAWGWTMTHTTQAWDVTFGDPSVVVAILDTGIRPAGLDDFVGQISSTWNAISGTTDATTNAGNHGTYVAGAVGLAIDNGVGGAGFCPQCKLMIVQVGNDSGAYVSDIASGLTWASDHGARVANMSWAGSSDSSTLRSATTYAHSKGVVMTAAAGNSGCDCVTYPSGDPYVVPVAAVDNAGNKQGYSNYGNWVQLAAPAGDLTAVPDFNGQPGYAPVGGTSMASPVVAGIAGLLFSANPDLTNDQVVQALKSSAVPVNFNIQSGRVDALAALQYLGFNDPQPASPPINVAPPTTLVETNGLAAAQPLTGAPQVGQVLLRGQGHWTGSAPLSLTNIQWLRCDAAGGCAVAAAANAYTVQTTDVGFAFELGVTVANPHGSVTLTTPATWPVGATTTAPAISSLPVITGTAQVDQILSASPGSWSNSPTGYAYAWQRCDASGGSCTAITGATGSSYAVQIVDVSESLRVSVTASNSAGSTTAVSLPTAVVSGAPSPSPSPSPSPTPSPSPSTQTVTYSANLNPNNPTRTFTVTVGSGMADARLSFSKCISLKLALSTGASATGPSVVVLDAVLSAGTYSYTVSGGRCSFSLSVTAPPP